MSGKGLQVAPKKVEAIQKMPRPQNVHELRRFVGAINYLGRFIPRLYSILEPLYQLTRKKSSWLWTSTEEDTFKKAKEALTSPLVLKYFNKDIQPALLCDGG